MSAEEGNSKGSATLGPGTMVDHYRIIRTLGAGGMAEVYLARDTMLGRKVALKIINSERTGKSKAVEQFLFEAKATARFNHPHIVTIFNVGMSSGIPYLALEYLEGQTLRERLEQERLSVKEAVRIGKAIADALSAAHKKKILHRDLKPENVMLARDGRLRVLDFGLSQLLQNSDAVSWDSSDADLSDVLKPNSRLTLGQAGIRGTPAYMAPEHWKGEKIGSPADVWALGLILYEMLAGRHPYQDVHETGNIHGLTSTVTSLDPVPQIESRGHIPFDLVELLGQCLAKAPQKRPTAFDVAQELERFLKGEKQEDLTGINPFRGLSSFEEEHSHLYFGREAEINSFVERLRYEPVLPIVGISGAGKSSFVKAGVIPRLREKGPLILIQIRPGLDPFFALASSLMAAFDQSTQSMNSSVDPLGRIARREKTYGESVEQPIGDVSDVATQLFEQPQMLSLWLNRLAERDRVYVVLFVDQLEELCAIDRKDELKQNSTDMVLSKSSDENNLSKSDVSTRFMQAIAAAADDPQLPVRVILTVREEFLTRLMTGVLVRETLNRFAILRKPSSKTLTEILERSVKAVGYKFEDYLLASQLVSDVRKVQACFPLLQFACEILWQNRDKQRRVLTRAAYEEMGGVAGALVQHAEGVLKGLNTEEISIARTLLLRLVTEDKTRRIVIRHNLLEGLDARAEQVLERLVESRLITISRKKEEEGEGDCELAHEALINQWETLERWIDEGREELRLLRQLEQAAQLWDKRGRRVDELWGKQALKETKILGERNFESNQLVKDFERASENYIRKGDLRRIAVIGIVLIVLVSSVWFGYHFLRGQLCTGAENEITSIWNPIVKKSVGKAILGTKVSYAKDTVDRVYKLLDGYTNDWVAHYKNACEATHVKGNQSDEVLDLRMTCLRKRKREVGALIKVFAKADVGVVQKAVLACTSLTDIGICADAEVLRASYPPPKTAEAKTKVAAIREALVEVKAYLKTGKYREGLDLVKKLEKDSNAVHYRPVQAEVLFELGRLLEALGKYKEAETFLQYAARAAGESRDVMLAARAIVWVVWVVGYRQARQEEGLSLGRYAEVVLDLGKGDEMLRSQLFNNIGVVLDEKGEYDEALEYYRKSLAIRDKVLGPDHPEVAHPLNNMGVVYLKKGDYDKALKHFRKALAIWQEGLGHEHPLLAATLNNIGLVYKDNSEYNKALEYYRKSLQIWRSALGEDHPYVAMSLHNIGNVMRKLGEYDRALKNLNKALAIRERSLGFVHPLVASTLSFLGNVFIIQGQTGKALESLERVLAICEEMACEPETEGIADFGLARTLVATGKDKERAIKLAKQASEIFNKTPNAFHKELKDVNTWLQKHGASKLAKKVHTHK